MAKYLIQDIIPASKKKLHDEKTAKAHPHAAKEAGSITHHAKAAHDAPRVHRATHHVAHKEHEDVAAVLPPENISHDTAPLAQESVLHDDFAANPRSMLLDQIRDDAHAEKQEISPEISHQWISDTQNHTKLYNENNPPPHFPEESPRWQFKGGWIPWVVAPIGILILAMIGLSFFAGAKVWVIPKHDVIPIPDGQVFIADKNSTDDMLGYSIMRATSSDTREVAASGTKTVTAKASGRIIVYNEQTVPQRLIKNTRFQSAKGLIYRINDSITIPKSTTPKGGNLVPGSFAVTVYADEAGPAYNSEPTDFSVPGLKDTPQAKKVYARSSGAITGGASGTTKSVSDQDLNQAGEDLRVSLETKLRSKARGELFPSQIAFDQGIIVDLEAPKLSTDQASSDEKAVVTESGAIYVVVFDRAALTRAIAKALVPTYVVGDQITIKNIESLSMSMPAIKGDQLFAGTKLEFSLKGSPELTWVLNEEEIKKDLLGIPKSDFNTIMGKYLTIERAKASLTPFWSSTFPTDPEKITLDIVMTIPE